MRASCQAGRENASQNGCGEGMEFFFGPSCNMDRDLRVPADWKQRIENVSVKALDIDAYRGISPIRSIVSPTHPHTLPRTHTHLRLFVPAPGQFDVVLCNVVCGPMLMLEPILTALVRACVRAHACARPRVRACTRACVHDAGHARQ